MLRFLLWLLLFIFIWKIFDMVVRSFMTGYQEGETPDHDQVHQNPPVTKATSKRSSSRLDIHDAEFYDLDDQKENK